MSFLGKEYVFTSQENFDSFLRALKLPEEQIAKFLEFKPRTTISKEGDEYVVSTTSSDGTRTTKFKSGVEFDDLIQGVFPVKSKITVEGNTVTQSIRGKGAREDTEVVFKKEFDGDNLTVTLTLSQWDGAAKRFYKAN